VRCEEQIAANASSGGAPSSVVRMAVKSNAWCSRAYSLAGTMGRQHARFKSKPEQADLCSERTREAEREASRCCVLPRSVFESACG
jgi:hypothetical protein